MTLEIRSVGSDAQQSSYEGRIRPLLVTIRTRAAGRALLTRLEASTKRVRIVPFGRADQAAMGHNAVAVPAHGPAGFRRGSERGAGTHSSVHFTPGMWRGRRVQSQPDEVLFHELCHSFRQINGLERTNRIVSFEDVEEYFAALVTSIYSSENNRPPLGNHGFWTLRDASVLSQPPYSTWIERFRTAMPGFIGDLAAIPTNRAQFNPFRAAAP